MIIDKVKFNSTIGFESGILYCFNNNLKGEYCNQCRSKSDCRSLTIEEQRKYFEDHQDEFAERIRRYNSGNINVR